jgi:nitroimidazol reductase NimA-like FMN-containing flavoprotein (pyridoxamine 5'-phosphate oxidase superfamily)
VPSRRNDITMSLDEQVEFLDNQRFGVLATIGPTGFPHQVTIGFDLDGPDTIVMSSFGAAQKVVNARRSPRASFLAEHPTPYAEIRGVLLTGPIEVVDERDRVAEWFQRAEARSARLLDPDTLPPMDIERVVAKRVLLVLSVDHRVSWDHRKLGGVY